MNTEIKTVEQAFSFLGKDINALPDVSMIDEKSRQAILSHYKLIVVAEALNKEANGGETWTPDWDNMDQRKYYPWFEISKEDKGSGFGFSCTDYDYGYTDTIVGSRLCFLSRELALYAAKQFEQLYKDYFIIQ